jgi:hypothetical protein
MWGRKKGQRGAAMIEVAATISLFLLMVLAMIEFAMLTMSVARVNEVTRDLVRIAIVNDPLCDIFNGGCPGPVSTMNCPGGAPVTVTLAQAGNSCTGTNTTGCRMLERATSYMRNITPEQIEVTYACSVAGAVERPEVIPLITVGLRNVTHGLIFPDFLGLTRTQVTLPAFETSRTGEALYTVRAL